MKKEMISLVIFGIFWFLLGLGLGLSSVDTDQQVYLDQMEARVIVLEIAKKSFEERISADHDLMIKFDTAVFGLAEEESLQNDN
jgi:hypothetical protein